MQVSLGDKSWLERVSGEVTTVLVDCLALADSTIQIVTRDTRLEQVRIMILLDCTDVHIYMLQVQFSSSGLSSCHCILIVERGRGGMISVSSWDF